MPNELGIDELDKLRLDFDVVKRLFPRFFTGLNTWMPGQWYFPVIKPRNPHTPFYAVHDQEEHIHCEIKWTISEQSNA